MPDNLRARLDGCMLADRKRLGRRLRGLDKGRMPKAKRDRVMEQIGAEIDRAAERRAARAASVPEIAYADDLPVAAAAGTIAEAIREHQVIVVCGETGSGKTTQLPKICLEAGRGIDGLIGHTQPRRIAARSVATRIAEEMGVELGGVVGAKVRFGDQTAPETLVKLMTDGVLLAESRGDRDLVRYDTIIIDEAHERSLNIDFLLGYLTRLLPKRPDLKIVITSATIDPQRFADHFEKHLHAKCPVIEVSGRSYPVDVRYRPPVESTGADAGSEDIATWSAEGGDLTTGVLAVMDEIDAEAPNAAGGDVLVFMPGEREIRDTAKALRDRYGPRSDVEVLPLYARLSNEEQRRAFAPHRGRRIVVATNVAETSVTVPGIRYVIDPGLARISRYSSRTKVQGLPVEPISRASADQRKGRCGRVGPGVCYRLYTESDYEARDRFTPPEIMRTNLAGVVLQMASLKLGRPERFPFVEPPESRLIRDGYDTLRELGAVSEDGDLTKAGEEMARLPIDPRVARMLIAAHGEDCLSEVLIIASGLSVADPRERPPENQGAADQVHATFRNGHSDFLTLLNLWHFYHDHLRPLSRSKRAKACAQHFISERRMREWQEVQQQIRALLTDMGYRFNGRAASADAVHRALLAGLLTNIGRKRSQHEYEGTRGSKFSIHPGSVLFESKPKWLMAAELVRTTRLYARTTARIDPAWIEPLAGDLVKKTHAEPHFDEKTARIMASERVTLAGLEIVSRRRVHYGPIDPIESRRLFIHEGLVAGGLTTNARAINHNRELERELSELEHKARRRDLLAEATARFAFYDQRIPPGIYTGDAFERWLRREERGNPRALFMARDDILMPGAEALEPEAFPDALPLGKTELSLDYRFEPGEMLDGVTAEVPVGVLGQLSQDQADRLVPGLLAEKIESLIRTLPKSMRRQFDIGPLSRRLAPEIAKSQGSFIGALAAKLSRLTGVRITAEMFRPEELEPHLRLNVRVVGDDGGVLAEGRDLRAIKAELAQHVSRGFTEVTQRDDAWNKDGLTDWTFGDLPRRIDIDAGGMTVHGYPAIVDQGPEDGGVVGLRLVDSREAADRLTRRGLMRLLVRRLKHDLKVTPSAIAGFGELAALHAALGTSAQLKDELMLLVAERVFIGDAQPPRTAEAFTVAIDRGWNRLSETVDEVTKTVRSTLARRQDVAALLEADMPGAWDPARRDALEQMSLLFRDRFLTHTPYRWLRCYSRYLRAIRVRFERLRGGGEARDREAMAAARHWQAKWAEKKSRHDADGITDPELEELRWMIEEYRVSLFAQELKTIISISPKRLERQWEKTRP